MYNSVQKSTEVSKHDRKTEGWISDLVGALCDPVICHRGQLDRPPEKVAEAIHLERLVENMVAMNENRQPTGTDAEAAWYLSTASLEAMFSHEWYEIYMYAFNKLCATMKTEVPEDLRAHPLDNQEMGMYNDLKLWIYAKRSEARFGRDKQERKGKRELVAEQQQIQTKKESELQPKMFQF